MHIHSNHMTPGITNPYVVAAAEKAAASERAAKVRKKLLKSAAKVDSIAVPDEDLLIGKWMVQRNSPTQEEDAIYRPNSTVEPDSY